MTKEEKLREIDEALMAGNEALGAIGRAESKLSGARGFGIWDMFGGGLISGLLKHSQMDDAQRYVNDANQAIKRFQKELSDINMSIQYGVSFDGVTKAIDILFDNILVDALIQSRIRETQKNLEQTKQQVQYAVNTLYQLRRETEAQDARM